MSTDDETKKTLDISHKEQTFRTDVGVRATVQHMEMRDGDAAPINNELIHLGISAQGTDPALKHCKYCGSAAVHIYKAEGVGQLFFISQTEPLVRLGCAEMLASAAFNHLLATLKKMYGHRRPRLRSGF